MDTHTHKTKLSNINIFAASPPFYFTFLLLFCELHFPLFWVTYLFNDPHFIPGLDKPDLSCSATYTILYKICAMKCFFFIFSGFLIHEQTRLHFFNSILLIERLNKYVFTVASKV